MKQKTFFTRFVGCFLILVCAGSTASFLTRIVMTTLGMGLPDGLWFIADALVATSTMAVLIEET